MKEVTAERTRQMYINDIEFIKRLTFNQSSELLPDDFLTDDRTQKGLKFLFLAANQFLLLVSLITGGHTAMT